MSYAFIDTQHIDGDEMAGETNQDIARRTDDHKEGVRAFIEKRQPKYLGR